MNVRSLKRGSWLLAVIAAVCPIARAAEHVTLRNGFEIDCVRREITGERVRLYLADTMSGSDNYLEVATTAIVRVEALAAPTTRVVPPSSPSSKSAPAPGVTPAEMTALLTSAGKLHHIDADMLASVVKAESGGHVRAVSRTGARGLMQLMPATATQLGVRDSFQADQNIAGGTAYFDQLMTRYHDNAVLAIAAYNAGPGAVDRWHGIPPYRETQAYVVRVIREFNRRKQLALTASTR